MTDDLKPTDEEFERLWVPLARRFGVYPSYLLQDIAWFVLELGYRCEQTATQTGTDDENNWDYDYVYKGVKPRQKQDSK